MSIESENKILSEWKRASDILDSYIAESKCGITVENMPDSLYHHLKLAMQEYADQAALQTQQGNPVSDERELQILLEKDPLPSQQQGNPVWVRASERLPEFDEKQRTYVVRYINSKHPYETWNWDWINTHPRLSEIEWLDESPSTEDVALEMPKDIHGYENTIIEMCEQRDKQEQEIQRLKELVAITAKRFYQNGMQQWVSVVGSKRLSTNEDYKAFNKRLAEDFEQFKQINNID